MTADQVVHRALDMLPEGTPMPNMLGMVKFVEARIVARGAWAFFRKEGTFELIASYSTGTVAITNGSDGVVGTGTTFAEGMIGRKIRVSGGQEYTISAFTDTENITLDRNVEEATASGETYVIYENEYSLASDLGRLAVVWNTTNQIELVCVNDLEARTRDAVWREVARPALYATMGRDANGYVNLYVQPYPTDAAHIVYYYTRKHTASTTVSSTIDFPGELDEVVVQGVYARALQMIGDDGWRPGWNMFNAMLDDAWAKDEPATGFTSRLQRGDHGWPPCVSRFTLPRLITE